MMSYRPYFWVSCMWVRFQSAVCLRYSINMKQRQGVSALFWRFVRPDIEELTVYIILSIVLACMAMYQLAVSGQIDRESLDITTSFRSAISGILAFMSEGSWWAKFFLFGFWFIVGGIAYSLVWATITLLVDLRNDIEVSASFVHPKSFRQGDYWASVVARAVLRGTSGIALVFYGVYWVMVFAPVYIAIFQRFFTDIGDVSNILSALMAIVWLFLSLHLGAILLRLTLLKPSR